MIYMLEFIKADGSISDGGYVAEGGQIQEVFALEPDERIVRVEADQSETLYGLRIHTSKGRESPWYGSHNGVPQEFAGSAEDPIVGFQRGAEGVCPKLVTMQRLRGSMLDPTAPQILKVLNFNRLRRMFPYPHVSLHDRYPRP